MDKRLEIVEARRLRYEIITMLYEFYGEDITLNTIKSLLKYKKYYSDKDVKRALCYLSDEDREHSAYIKIQENLEDYWDSPVRLTRSGVKLAEGDRNETGVVIDE